MLFTNNIFNGFSQLFTWGWNQRGTLGHPPEKKTESIPSLVKSLANVKITQVKPNHFNFLIVVYSESDVLNE